MQKAEILEQLIKSLFENVSEEQMEQVKTTLGIETETAIKQREAAEVKKVVDDWAKDNLYSASTAKTPEQQLIDGVIEHMNF